MFNQIQPFRILLVSLVLALFCAAVQAVGLFGSFQAKLDEPYFALRALRQGHSEKLSIVLYGEDQLRSKKEQSPVSREVLWNLADRLISQGAKGVGFCVNFDEDIDPKTWPEGSQRLQNKVVMAFHPKSNLKEPKTPKVLTGHIKYQLQGQSVRKVLTQVEGGVKPFYQVVLANFFADQSPFNLSESNKAQDIVYFNAPSIDGNHFEYFPKYRSGEIALLTKEQIEGRFFLIGPDPEEIPPSFSTPLRLIKSKPTLVSTAEIQANILESILVGQQVVKPNLFSVFLITWVGSYLLLMVLLRLEGWVKFMILDLGLMVVLWLVGLLLFCAFHFVIPLFVWFLALQGLFGWILFTKHQKQLHRGVGLKVNLNRKEDQLKELEHRIAGLTSRQILSLEEERKRIAREIHDDIGQTLTTLKFDLHMVKKSIPHDDDKNSERLTEMLHRIHESFVSLKRIVVNLKPKIIEDMGLEASLEWLCEDFQKRTGIECEFSPLPKMLELDLNRAILLFRTVQELLTNALKHASAKRLRCTLKQAGDDLFLMITDNGKGIAKADLNQMYSYGLKGIEERLSLFHGQLRIKGIQKRGTSVRIRIPLSYQPEELPPILNYDEPEETNHLN